MALVLGDENRAMPTPVIISAAIMYGRDVSALTNTNIRVPTPQQAIPPDDSLKGEYLSESFPIFGVSTAITTGCAMRISPAV